MIETCSPDWMALEMINERRRRGESMDCALLYARAHQAWRMAASSLLGSMEGVLRAWHAEGGSMFYYCVNEEYVEALLDDALDSLEKRES